VVGVAVAMGGAGCGEAEGLRRGERSSTPVPPAYLIRPARAERVDGRASGSVAAEPVDVVGDVRQAFRFEEGVELTIGLIPLPAPAWLDVAVASLVDESAGGEDAAVPPTPRLIVVRETAGQRTTLFDGFPSPGRPPAFGWAATRLELRESLDHASLLHFRAELPSAGVAARFALAVPRVAPRVTARERGAAFIDWSAEIVGPLPTAAELGDRLAAAGTVVEMTAADAAPPLPERHPARALLAAGIEREQLAFGPVPLADDLLLPARDRWCRFDPWGDAADDAAMKEGLANGFAREVLVERGRLLGEHLLFTELARPRLAPISVRVATRVTAEHADAALARLLGFIAANDLIDRVVLRVRRVEVGAPRSGAFTTSAWWRWPAVLGEGALPAD
jgi:hypothetical protein